MGHVKSSFLIGISLLLWLATAFGATDASNALQARLDGIDGVVARFEQQITDMQGFMVEESRGTLHLAKPRFRWEVQTPFPQIILADGDAVEIYDPDLEQVTQRELSGAAHEAPLALLTRADLVLDEHFWVRAQSTEAGVERYTLTPRSADALFETMDLVFRGAALDAMAIRDHSGQQTLIRFADYQARQVIQSSVFELEYPPGTDFVRG